jgi:D-alanyl-D-alanine carboxypeptidase/D-alanyl-D-alanine-endopeptidase (penicillin-binding protein 4)
MGPNAFIIGFSMSFRRPLVFAAALLSLAAAPPAVPAAKLAEREALRTALVGLIKRTPLKAARISVQVMSLDDGTVVFAQNADDLLNPASNVKLVTAAAALSKMGLDYRFDTEVLTDAELKDGKAKLLYVRGKGDPTLNTDKLYGIVSELLHAGLKEVSGDLVIDDTFFDADRLAPGFDQESSDRSYMAPTGAVSLNWNAVGVYLRPGAALGDKATVELEPASDYFDVDSELSTGTKRRKRYSVASDPEKAGQKQKILVRGTVPLDEKPGSWSVWKKIDNPPQYFGQTLKRLLADRGVKVKGKVRLGAVPSSAKSLHVSQSDTLDLVLKKMNKHSSNFVAEQLLKTLGAEAKGAPASFASGVEAVEDFLEQDVGIARGTYVMKNGSGLNDTNRFSAAQFCKLLKVMYEKFPVAPEYLSSVGVAGKDGTLKYRFEGSDAVGRLRAKTGTLENVSALSGYVQAVGGEKFVFSVLVNDFPGRAGTVVQHIDALGAAVAATGSALGPDRAVAAMMTAPTVVGPLDELKSRAVTFLAVGRQADKRNIAFLRTAWRTEKDPAVRAIIADSLYQSDPQDYVGARLLLDSFTAGDDVYGRLRLVAAELQVEVPGFSSVVELAAGGSADALTRLVELARAVGSDAKAEAELAEALAEVARTAPDELLLVMRGAGAPDKEPAMRLLALGLVKAADAEHPFWPALRKAMGSLDPATASFAKGTDVYLSQKIAEEKAPKAAAVVVEPKPPAVEKPAPGERPGG